MKPTKSSYFSPPPKVTKSPTPSSILIKQIQNNSNSIRLRLNKKQQQIKSQSHQKNIRNTSQRVLRKTKGHSSILSYHERDNKSLETESESSSSYCISSNSDSSESKHIFICNLSNELNALTTTNLQSPSHSIHSTTQNESQEFSSTTYPYITIPSGIAKLILLDSKKQDQTIYQHPSTYPHQVILLPHQLNPQNLFPLHHLPKQIYQHLCIIKLNQ